MLGTLEDLMLPQCKNASVGVDAAYQAISREELGDRAWLAGIIDGEGTMSLTKNKARRGYFAKISIVNCDPRMIQRVSQIWSRRQVKYFYHVGRQPERRWRLVIAATGYGGVSKVLTHVLPYLTAKRDQAECLLSFIAWRQTIGFHQGPVRFETLHERAEQVRTAMKRLVHQEFDPQRLSRTASCPLQIQDEGRVWTAVRKAELGSNDRATA